LGCRALGTLLGGKYGGTKKPKTYAICLDAVRGAWYIYLINEGEIPARRKEIMATLTVKEVAIKLDTDPRTLRKFLRSDASTIDPVGKGARYAIEAKAVRSLTTRFKAWDAARAAATEADDAEVEVTADEAPAAD
jgi:hypothetical protein